MPAFLEITLRWGRRQIEPLNGDRVTVGQSLANDVALPGERTVSPFHAIFERTKDSWSIRDVGSTHGTFVNGDRMTVPRTLRPGDRISLGETNLRFRDEEGDSAASLEQEAVELPEMTPAERDVLVLLCKPLLRGTALSQPTPANTIADELRVSEISVKLHLLSLYDKFSIAVDEANPRGRLAAEALRLGVVTLDDLPNG